MDTASQTSQEETRKTFKLYSSISDLPFYVYVKAVCENDLSEIEDWDKIQEEFSDAIGNMENDNINLIAEIESLNKQYELAIIFISILQNGRNEIIEGQLSILGIDIEHGDTEAATGKVESIKIEIAEKIERLNIIMPQSEQTQINRQFFVDICARMTRHFKGARIQVNDINLMTDEFCSHYRAFQEEMEYHKNHYSEA